jgi:hypothetical protein
MKLLKEAGLVCYVDNGTDYYKRAEKFKVLKE